LPNFVIKIYSIYFIHNKIKLKLGLQHVKYTLVKYTHLGRQNLNCIDYKKIALMYEIDDDFAKQNPKIYFNPQSKYVLTEIH
jgi:hypothetical protein